MFIGVIRTLVHSYCGKTYYPYFLTAARVPWRITRVPHCISVVMVILSVAKLRRFGMLRFLYCKWDCACTDGGPVLRRSVFKPSPVTQALSDLTFGRSASLSNFCLCFSNIFSPLLWNWVVVPNIFLKKRKNPIKQLAAFPLSSVTKGGGSFANTATGCPLTAILFFLVP